jgi:hypothetical protein
MASLELLQLKGSATARVFSTKNSPSKAETAMFKKSGRAFPPPGGVRWIVPRRLLFWRLMYLRLFLKVCEGCGILWFRAHDCSDVYCPACVVKMRALPAVRRVGRRGGRKRPACHGNSAGGAA